MKILIIGLGSMGKRRIRCLQNMKVDNSDIYGFDLKQERVENVKKLYSISTYDNFENAIQNKPEIFIISVPPDIHYIYMEYAVKNNINYFVEASVLDTNYKYIIDETYKKNIIGFPSFTLWFHPAIQYIKNNLSNRIGSTIIYLDN